MPRYANNTEAPITPAGGPTILPGESGVWREYLTDAGGLTLTEHAPAGSTGVLLFADTPPSDEITGLAAFPRIRVANGTTADIVLQPNDDTTNTHTVLSGEAYYIDNCNPRAWYSVTITGDGTGTVNVIGLRNATKSYKV